MGAAGGLSDDPVGVVCEGRKGRPPQAWSRGVPWGSEDGGSNGVEHSDGVLGDSGGAVGVAEAGEAEEIAGEAGDDMAAARCQQNGWEMHHGRSRCHNRVASSCPYCGGGAVSFDVVERGRWDEVVVRGPRVDNCCVRRWR